ncbi:MAG: hypothetical protein M0Z95_25210 [Actinomycetota bacterium]|jgi:hypothetical protein|nr:hypothetical protein [Actinomycetota bacterium]
MKRPTWLAVGVVLGAGGALWAEARLRREVRRTVARFDRADVAGGVVRAAREGSAKVRDAVDAGRVAKARREAELWSTLDDGRPGGNAGR